MATTRRTAKITAAYVAIHIDYIDASTNIVPCTAKKAMRIEGVNGAVVEIKAGEKFFLHRAASLGENMFYIVRQVAGVKRCSCPARKPCKHEIAITARTAKPVVAPYVREETDDEAKTQRWQTEELATIAGRDFAVVLPVRRPVAEAPLRGVAQRSRITVWGDL